MNKPGLEIGFEQGNHVDTLSNKSRNSPYLYIKSGMRVIYISIDTVIELANKFREKGFVI